MARVCSSSKTVEVGSAEFEECLSSDSSSNADRIEDFPKLTIRRPLVASRESPRDLRHDDRQLLRKTLVLVASRIAKVETTHQSFRDLRKYPTLALYRRVLLEQPVSPILLREPRELSSPLDSVRLDLDRVEHFLDLVEDEPLLLREVLLRRELPSRCYWNSQVRRFELKRAPPLPSCQSAG